MMGDSIRFNEHKNWKLKMFNKQICSLNLLLLKQMHLPLEYLEAADETKQIKTMIIYWKHENSDGSSHVTNYDML